MDIVALMSKNMVMLDFQKQIFHCKLSACSIHSNINLTDSDIRDL